MKKLFKLSKLNVIALALVACVAIIATAGGSIAYFSDNKEITNTFTAGNVYISLTESAVVRNAAGNLVADPTQPRVEGVAIDDAENVVVNHGNLYPGMTIDKDPTIKNTGSERAFVAAKVIITGDDILYALADASGLSIDIEELLKGGLLDETIHIGEWNGIASVCHNDNYAMVQVADTANGVYEFYFFMKNAFDAGESVCLFNQMRIDPMYGNVEMAALSDLSLTVQAYAVQTFGFGNCYDAMIAAFEEEFAAVAPATPQG